MSVREPRGQLPDSCVLSLTKYSSATSVEVMLEEDYFPSSLVKWYYWTALATLYLLL